MIEMEKTYDEIIEEHDQILILLGCEIPPSFKPYFEFLHQREKRLKEWFK